MLKKLQEIESIILHAESVEDLVEKLFWIDCYIVDDAQWIYDANRGAVYSHTLPYYATIMDLKGMNHFRMYEEDDQDLIDELEIF